MNRTRQSGFTLTELVITILVFAVLAVVSVPNFVELRERQALRGAMDNFTVAVGQAKMEAIKRGEMVRVEFNEVGDTVCMGANVVDVVGGAGCDCSAANCPVGSFPEETGDTGALRRVKLDGDVLFGADGNGFVIDPRTGTLADLGSTGGFQLKTDKGYEVEMRVNVMGRMIVCTPTGAAKTLPGVDACD